MQNFFGLNNIRIFVVLIPCKYVFSSQFASHTAFPCTLVFLHFFFHFNVSLYIKMHNLLLKTVALELENTLFDSQMVA